MDNKNDGFLQGMGGWAQFFFFCFLFFSGLMLFSFAAFLFLNVREIESSARVMRMAQMIYQVCTFLIPAIAFAFLCQKAPKEYLKVDTKINTPILLLAILLIFVVQPIIDITAYYNQQISLPESLSFIEEKMRDSEIAAEKSIGLLFSDKTIFGLVSNLLIMAIVAGLVEEFFFRGCLQQIIQKIAKNEHIAVWAAAAIFSAIHFQFFGFVPRLLLGALLGYIFIWSGNIWIPVIVHTLNNAASITFSYIYYGTPEYENINSYILGNKIWFLIPGIIFTMLLLTIIYRRREKKVNS